MENIVKLYEVLVCHIKSRPLKQTDLEQALTSPKATEVFLAMKLFSADPGYEYIW